MTVGYFAAVRDFWMRLTAIIVKEMLPLRRDRLSLSATDFDPSRCLLTG